MKLKTFLITGAAGQLAREFQNILSKRGFRIVAVERKECDIVNFTQTRKLISRVSPDIIINCAAYNSVDEAEENSELAYSVNSDAVGNLAELCKKNNIFLVHYSTDYVFDGEKHESYTEYDVANPINIYGKSKLRGEQVVKEILSDFLIFRVSWVIGRGKQSFLYKIMNWAERSQVLRISCDEVSVPTYPEDIVNITLLSLEAELNGLYHLTNSGKASRYELTKYIAFKLGLKNSVVPVPMSAFNTKAKRPLCSCMSNKRISRELSITIPSWKDGIDRLVKALEKSVV